jgi:Bacterial protein of unknown function (DUF885)
MNMGILAPERVLAVSFAMLRVGVRSLNGALASLMTVLLVAGIACAQAAPAPTADKQWITESNKHAETLLEVIAKYSPEEASAYGVETHDTDIVDLKPQFAQRFAKDLEAAAAALESTRSSVSDPRVKQDIDILVGAARDRSQSLLLNDRLMAPYFDLPQMFFNSFHTALDPRVAKKRRAAALIRLRKYVGSERDTQPLVDLARAEYARRSGDTSLVMPWVVEVQQNLENQPRYMAGIRDLFKQSGLKGWEKDLDKLSRQVDDFGQWVRAEILPKARQNNQLPPEIYADNLKGFGVRMDPREIMDRALAGFSQIRDEMDSVARVVAERKGYKSADYRDVLRELKKERIADDKLLEIYKSRLGQIEKIARDEQLITLPKRDAVIRLATEAESAQTPAPHLDIPRLIGNTGEPGEFVLPTKNPNAQPGNEMDDFNYDAITWGLTAHEARPGHELQFASMIEQGVSTARAVFAFNSANAEGWGLYSEAIMKSFVPPEGQLGILQFRLMRAARAFLDPMLNLGLIDPDSAKRVLMEQVVLSEPMAKQEVDRYTFRSPGQATSYFYGYTKLSALRTRVEIALGNRFTPLAYHNFIIGEGLLPLDLLERAVMDNFVPSQRAAPVKAAAP